jgi:hypothetical protein
MPKSIGDRTKSGSPRIEGPLALGRLPPSRPLKEMQGPIKAKATKARSSTVKARKRPDPEDPLSGPLRR